MKAKSIKDSSAEDIETGSVAILRFNIEETYFNIYSGEFKSASYRDTSKSIVRKTSQDFNSAANLMATSHAATGGEKVAVKGITTCCVELKEK